MHLYVLVLNTLSNQVILKENVLCLLVIDRIFRHSNARRIILENNYWSLDFE